MEYEEKLKFAERNKHIPTEEVEQDIADIQAEIAKMEREIRIQRNGIEERKELIKKLQVILEIRSIPQK